PKLSKATARVTPTIPDLAVPISSVFKQYCSYYSFFWGDMRGDVTREMGHSVGLAHAGGCVIMVSDSYTRWDVCRIQTPQTNDATTASLEVPFGCTRSHSNTMDTSDTTDTSDTSDTNLFGKTLAGCAYLC